MRNAPLFLLLLLTIGPIGACTQAPAEGADESAVASDPIRGAWRLVERKLAGADGALSTNPQPGVRVFVDGTSCLVRVDAPEARPIPDSTATPEQLAAIWGPFTGQCATYEVSGDTVTERFFISKYPENMTAQSIQRSTFRIVGDTLWYSSIQNQAGPVAVPGYSKFTRARNR